MKTQHTIYLLFSLLIFSGIQAAKADVSEEEALLGLYGDEQMISIATGSEQPIAKAPAVATVITAEDIKEMGARDIDQVLESVPGLHVAINPRTNRPIYTLRGVFDVNNPQVLMLVNGIPITNLFVGDRGLIWGGMPVEGVSRIEVIRGPGSAVYGADAFSGVINVVTKEASEIDGTEAGVRYGSFNTRDFWLLHGGSYNGIELAFIAEINSTDGHTEDVDADAATPFGTSFAPGSTRNNRDNIDLRLDVRKDLWTFRAGLQRRRNYEAGVGVAEALDVNGVYESDRWNADITYANPEFYKNWEVEGQISYFNTTQEVDENIFLFPPGTDFTFFGGGPFPDGVIGNPEVFERHLRSHITAQYSGFEDHLVRLGTGYTNSEIYKVRSEQNFDPAAPGIFPTPIPFDDFTDTALAFLPEKHRDNKYVFVQDIWSVANDWELTLGLRYDDYNDFGDTWNPRFALVWSALQNLTVKLLYGQAFRAPSFAEFRNQNNPVALGNDQLDPEEMETIELAFDYRPADELRLGLNLFSYEWDDIIRFVPIAPGPGSPLRAQNVGEQSGYGAEFEFDWDVNRAIEIVGNYAFQYSEDDETNDNSGNAPTHQVYLRVVGKLAPNWSIIPQWNYVIDRKRVDGDGRDKIDDYDVLDLTLRHVSQDGQWEFALIGKNILNARPFEPSTLGSTGLVSIPGDIPLARRSGYAELRINF